MGTLSVHKKENHIFSFIIALGLIVRIGFLWKAGGLLPDAATYYQAGRSLFKNLYIDSDLVMPIYPIWSYLWGGGTLLQVVELLISTASIILIALLCDQIFKSKLVSLIAALIAAIYPFFAFYSTTGITETLFIFITLLFFLLLYRGNFYWGITVIVISILIRPIFDFIGPLIIFFFSFFVHKQHWKKSLLNIGKYFIIYIFLMSPWWLHNFKKYNQFVRLNISEGIILYAGNNPLNTSGGGVQYIPSSGTGDFDYLPYIERYPDPIERNRVMKQDAFNYITNDIPHFIKMFGVKFLRFWRLYPYAPEYSSKLYIIGSLVSFLPILLFSIISMLFYKREHWVALSPVFLYIAFLTFVHCVTISSIRYRLPLEPFLIIMASFGVTEALKRALPNCYSKLSDKSSHC